LKYKQLQINRKYGKQAEQYATRDFLNHGFTIFYTGGHGNDFFVANERISYFVEVKFNQARLTKTQKKFKFLCKKIGANFFLYRVSLAQLQEAGMA
tara:strand:+ start:449 stop:736 length:288 start_codon:yes stop_codon:yes gene_type:complete